MQYRAERDCAGGQRDDRRRGPPAAQVQPGQARARRQSATADAAGEPADDAGGTDGVLTSAAVMARAPATARSGCRRSRDLRQRDVPERSAATFFASQARRSAADSDPKRLAAAAIWAADAGEAGPAGPEEPARRPLRGWAEVRAGAPILASSASAIACWAGSAFAEAFWAGPETNQNRKLCWTVCSQSSVVAWSRAQPEPGPARLPVRIPSRRRPTSCPPGRAARSPPPARRRTGAPGSPAISAAAGSSAAVIAFR